MQSSPQEQVYIVTETNTMLLWCSSVGATHTRRFADIASAICYKGVFVAFDGK